MDVVGDMKPREFFGRFFFKYSPSHRCAQHRTHKQTCSVGDSTWSS